MHSTEFEAQAYLAAIIESSDDAIISKDLDGFITSWNKSARRIFGYTAEEAVGRHITLIIPSDRLHEEDEIISKLKKGQRIEHFETYRRHKDGHLIPISLTISPILNDKGQIIGASKVSRDISDRIAAENALKEMSRKKDEFLAHMSHELRTPMNAVVGLSSLLQNSKDLSERDRKFVETLKISADNMMDLINDLLDFGKIESQHLELESVEFDLAEQVEKAVRVAEVKAREKKLTLNVGYHVPLESFVGDPLRVHQILMNLLSNAVKFTTQGTIDVEVTGTALEADSTMISLSVRDTGIGIFKDKLPLIFDKFTQADSSITRQYGGSGLGLAICRALAEKMGGTIDVKSELGVGSVFTVRIPLKNSTHAAIKTIQLDQRIAKPILPMNVLLVEDYEPNILVTTSVLEDLGYKYDIAYNGFEALCKFSQGKYDVILMDIQMPRLDGLEAARRIRKIEQEEARTPTPIVAMTAHVKEQNKRGCIEAGMDDFIAKPFEPTELSKKIARYIGTQAAA